MSGKWLMFAIGNTVYRLDTTNVANVEVVPNIAYNSAQQYTFCVDDDVVINGWYFYNGEPKLYVRNKATTTDGETWGQRMISRYKTYAYQEYFLQLLRLSLPQGTVSIHALPRHHQQPVHACYQDGG
jgi:hypothetical protein